MRQMTFKTILLGLFFLITSTAFCYAQSSLEYYKKFKNTPVKIVLINNDEIEGRIREVKKITIKENIYDDTGKKLRTHETILLELTRSLKLIARTEPRIVIDVDNILYFEEIKEKKTQ